MLGDWYLPCNDLHTTPGKGERKRKLLDRIMPVVKILNSERVARCSNSWRKICKGEGGGGGGGWKLFNWRDSDWSKICVSKTSNQQIPVKSCNISRRILWLISHSASDVCYVCVWLLGRLLYIFQYFCFTVFLLPFIHVWYILLNQFQWISIIWSKSLVFSHVSINKLFLYISASSF